eukprot:1274562-Lingulodinium_polyedra.AAC.1
MHCYAGSLGRCERYAPKPKSYGHSRLERHRDLKQLVDVYHSCLPHCNKQLRALACSFELATAPIVDDTHH